MAILGISIGPGINIGGGISIGAGSGSGTPGVDNVTGYLEMAPPIIPGNQLEDGGATINGSTGFTINDDTATEIGRAHV